MKASSRWRSEALVNPHQALEACQLSGDDRPANYLQRDVVHAVSTQDSESVQSLRARTDDSMNVLGDRKTDSISKVYVFKIRRSMLIWKEPQPPRSNVISIKFMCHDFCLRP